MIELKLSHHEMIEQVRNFNTITFRKSQVKEVMKNI